MTTMRLTILAAMAAALVPAAAQAQYASAQPAPLYPYVAQPGQPYAIEVAPGTYVIKRPSTRAYPYVRCVNGCDGSTPAAPSRPQHAVRRPTHNDPAVVEELRRRHAGKVKHDVVNTTRIVREKPVVIEHERVVDDPPRIIERRHYVDDAGRIEPAPPPPPQRRRTATIESDVHAPREVTGKGEKRVIRAEAEITILGPDRMNIRLFRKGTRGANAKADVD